MVGVVVMVVYMVKVVRHDDCIRFTSIGYVDMTVLDFTYQTNKQQEKPHQKLNMHIKITESRDIHPSHKMIKIIHKYITK